VTEGSEWTLRHDPNGDAPTIARLDFSGVASHERAARIEAAAASAQSKLDIDEGPLLAAAHFDCGAAPGRLLLAIHHLLVDGVSWRLLVEDLERAYLALEAGGPVSLPARTASFQRWSQALARFGEKADLNGSTVRWREIEAVPSTLPSTGSGGARNTEDLARTITVSLDQEETEDLLQRVPSAYKSHVNDVPPHRLGPGAQRLDRTRSSPY
jgi:NRPS condensation-like uncharacterized protein